jgi:hypothetical protein
VVCYNKKYFGGIMELVNKKYVRMHKFDIFTEMVKAGATEKVQDEERVSFFQNLLNVVMDYERNTKPRTYVEEFYVSVDDLDISDVSSIVEEMRKIFPKNP